MADKPFSAIAYSSTPELKWNYRKASTLLCCASRPEALSL